MYDTQKIKDADQIDLGVKHHFSDSIYAKEMHLPKGHVAVSHKHKYSHLSVLSQGICKVMTDKTEQILKAPAVIEIKAGVEHQIEALEDVIWLCIHATNETNPDKIDRVAVL